MNRYVVSEDTLKKLILKAMRYDILEGDGVDNWDGYMYSYKDYVAQYFPDLDDCELEEIDLDDCVELELQNYPLL